MNPIFQCLEIRKDNKNDLYGSFIIGPFPVGESLTICNALRRVLLSSLPGLGITAVRFKDKSIHEFSVLPNLRESVLDILFNLSQVIFVENLPLKGSAWGLLQIKKIGKFYARDLIVPPGLKIVNLDHYIGEMVRKPQNRRKGGARRSPPAEAPSRPSTAAAEDEGTEGTPRGGQGAPSSSQGETVEERRSEPLELLFLVTKGRGSISTMRFYESKNNGGCAFPVETYFSPVKKVNYRIEESLGSGDFPNRLRIGQGNDNPFLLFLENIKGKREASYCLQTEEEFQNFVGNVEQNLRYNPVPIEAGQVSSSVKMERVLFEIWTNQTIHPQKAIRLGIQEVLKLFINFQVSVFRYSLFEENFINEVKSLFKLSTCTLFSIEDSRLCVEYLKQKYNYDLLFWNQKEKFSRKLITQLSALCFQQKISFSLTFYQLWFTLSLSRKKLTNFSSIKSTAGGRKPPVGAAAGHVRPGRLQPMGGSASSKPSRGASPIPASSPSLGIGKIVGPIHKKNKKQKSLWKQYESQKFKIEVFENSIKIHQFLFQNIFSNLVLLDLNFGVEVEAPPVGPEVEGLEAELEGGGILREGGSGNPPLPTGQGVPPSSTLFSQSSNLFGINNLLLIRKFNKVFLLISQTQIKQQLIKNKCVVSVLENQKSFFFNWFLINNFENSTRSSILKSKFRPKAEPGQGVPPTLRPPSDKKYLNFYDKYLQKFSNILVPTASLTASLSIPDIMKSKNVIHTNLERLIPIGDSIFLHEFIHSNYNALERQFQKRSRSEQEHRLAPFLFALPLTPLSKEDVKSTRTTFDKSILHQSYTQNINFYSKNLLNFLWFLSQKHKLLITEKVIFLSGFLDLISKISYLLFVKFLTIRVLNSKKAYYFSLGVHTKHLRSKLKLYRKCLHNQNILILGDSLNFKKKNIFFEFQDFIEDENQNLRCEKLQISIFLYRESSLIKKHTWSYQKYSAIFIKKKKSRDTKLEPKGLPFGPRSRIASSAPTSDIHFDFRFFPFASYLRVNLNKGGEEEEEEELQLPPSSKVSFSEISATPQGKGGFPEPPTDTHCSRAINLFYNNQKVLSKKWKFIKIQFNSRILNEKPKQSELYFTKDLEILNFILARGKSTIRNLNNGGITTVVSLWDEKKISRKELLKIKNIGKKSVESIEKGFFNLGLIFPKEIKPSYQRDEEFLFLGQNS